jgi:hypothetical protein
MHLVNRAIVELGVGKAHLPDVAASNGGAHRFGQQKITFGELRESGVDRILIYCVD